MTRASALYQGVVTHERLRPRRHRLRYRVFWLLLDLAEIDEVARDARIFSRNRFNILSFRDRDYGDGSDRPLRDQVIEKLAGVGVDIGGGAVRLLTMPRVLGYAMNPISIYYCHRPDGALAAVVYEVTSTFKLRHSYVLPVATDAGEIRHSADKALYVSPFMDMDMRYDFRGRVPAGRLSLAIDGVDADGPLIMTAVAAHRVEITSRSMLAAWLRHPLMTVKVILGIHWEALKLLAKGVRLTHQPPPARETLRVR